MVPVGGLLVSAIVKMVCSQLGSAIGEQASLVWNLRSDMEHMRETLTTIEAVLADAERRASKDMEVQLWLQRLKVAAYDISDMLDDFQAAATQMTGILPVALQRILKANKMKNMRNKLRDIEAQHISFNFRHSTITISDQQPYDQRETTSDVNESDIIGRNTEKQKLLSMLSACHDNDGTTVLPIYGLGGIGKSSLAGLVYNDTQSKKYDYRVWVYVSQVFDLKKIGRSIISQIGEGHQNLDALQSINRWLDDLLHGKKVLIVLDDLWEEKDFELEKLKSMLHVGKNGSTIHVIVTTRKEDIAKKICTIDPYKLLPLKDDICWGIIKRSSQFERNTNKEQFARIGLAIAKKCGGVALAAQAVGYMLKSEDLHGWSEINNSNIWNESPEDDNSPHGMVLPSLKLSYEKMPAHLRLCFSYCAIFPKGQDIVEEDLIHQWMALDFANPSKGKEYTNQLLGMSFIQHSKLPSGSREHVVRYTMHDLVHDLARSVIGDDLVVIDATTKSSTSEQKHCRHALLRNYDLKTKLSNILPPNVRTLYFSDSRKLDLPGGVFSFAKYLRILDFSEDSSVLLPASIGQLKQLKFLIAPRMQNERLPDCITELSKLQYLNLHGSSQISALPESVGKLGCLIYLGLSHCSGLSKLPESFVDLKSLVHLDISHCSRMRELPASLGNLTNLQHLDLSNCSLVKEIPESLCGLTKLRYFNLSRCRCIERLPEAIGSLVNLEHVNMCQCYKIGDLPESFCNLRNLLRLELRMVRKGLTGALCDLTALQHLDLSYLLDTYSDRDDSFRHGHLSDALGNLTNLKYLGLTHSMDKLFGNEIGKWDGYVDFIGKLTNLEHLDLSLNPMLVHLPESIGNLKRLHTLDLSDCRNLKSLPKSIGNFKRLHTLDLSRCNNLMTLPESIAAINLNSLLVEGCSDDLIGQVDSRLHYSLTLPFFKVCHDNASGFSNLHKLGDVDIDLLRVHSLENVRSLDDAHRIKFLDKKNLLDLTLNWTLDAARVLDDRDLLGELLPPRGLNSLALTGYSSKSFPSWLMSISRHLPNLVSIDLYDLPTCRHLPPLGQLPNLKTLRLIRLRSIRRIDGDFCGGNGAFRRLSQLIIGDMEGLLEWNTTYSGEHGLEEFIFPMVEELSIVRCPRLRIKQRAQIFRRWCSIEESDLVISSLEELDKIRHVSSSAPSTRLEVRNSYCRSLRIFHHFPTLQELEISFCLDLASLPECMRHLASLQSLKMLQCDSISELPGWLGELTSLRSLVIARFDNLVSLPESLRHLVSLESLELRLCPRIPALPERMGDLSSLNSLVISGCEGIKSLPRCIQQLNKLRKLEIRGNGELKQWCESKGNKKRLAHINIMNLD